MRLINKDELKKKLKAERCDCEVIQIIDDMPAIDAEPVTHAKWYAPASYDPCDWCSNCRERTRWFFDEGFCPKCGAKMDGGDNDKSGEVHNQTQ